MELIYCSAIDESKTLVDNYDIFLVGCGYEIRSRYFSSIYKGCTNLKIALAFSDRKVLSRLENEKYFLKSGFLVDVVDGDDYESVNTNLLKNISVINKSSISILIDYSCMTKVMYATILNFFRYADVGLQNVKLDFVYSMPLYHRCAVADGNMHVGPLPGFSGLQLPSRPTCLILGLGCEKGRSEPLKEYVDPEILFAFYADPTRENRYIEDAKKANYEIFRDVFSDNIIKYPLFDFNGSLNLLLSVVSGVTESHRVILAPLGPKPFTLCCMIQALLNPDIDVWRISGGKIAKPGDVLPDGSVLAARLEFKA